MRPQIAMYGDVFQLRITLRGIEPPIWRGLQLPAEVTLGSLHELIQIAFGWQDSHLHDFKVGEVRFGMSDVDDELFCADEHAAPLGAVAREGSIFTYRYDFGDDWEHDVVVENVLDGGDEQIVCTGGARSCPPEDCGGPPGYRRLLEVLMDPRDDEHASMRTWVGKRFDSEKFDLAAVNRKLATQLKRRRSLTPGRRR